MTPSGPASRACRSTVVSLRFVSRRDNGRVEAAVTLAGVDDWPEPVERVAAARRARGIDARREEFPDGTATAAAAARAGGCDASEAVKSMVFGGDGPPVVARV